MLKDVSSSANSQGVGTQDNCAKMERILRTIDPPLRYPWGNRMESPVSLTHRFTSLSIPIECVREELKIFCAGGKK